MSGKSVYSIVKIGNRYYAQHSIEDDNVRGKRKTSTNGCVNGMISRPNRGPNVGGHLNWPNRKINKTKNEVNINTAAILAALVDSSTDNGPPRMRKLIEGTFGGWFLISIPHGQKYDKEYLLKELQSVVAPESLNPRYIVVESSALCFYVNDVKIAQTLLNANRLITLPDGYKMIIHVRNSMPLLLIDDNIIEKMKRAMEKRYTAATKALDLTKFQEDVEFKDIYCALLRPSVMSAVIDIIAENIPDLEALDLSDNKIRFLDHLRLLATKVPCLKILHMANNKISTLKALDALKESKLEDLVLKGNPFRDIEGLREESAYVSEIRKRFPKLLRLDFVNLPPMIGFDIPDNVNMPTPKPFFLCNYSGADIVRRFLEQYFSYFDSENRSPLVDAYHEHAMFSLTATHGWQRLGSYLPHNRNILRNKDYDARIRHLKTGRLSIISFLSELPATQHDPHSFAVDLSFFTPELMQLTVTGIYRERSKPSENICSFQRILVIVPSGSGFCIKNEMMQINNPTMEQIKGAFQPNNQPNPAPIAHSTVPEVTPSTSATSSVDDATKLQMIRQMSQQTNMNLEWSEKCLSEMNWNFDRATLGFIELNNQQKIPAEAFAK